MNTNIFSHIHSLLLILFLTQIVIGIEYCRPSRLNYFIEVEPTPKHNIDRRLMISSKPNVQGNKPNIDRRLMISSKPNVQGNSIVLTAG